MSLAKTAIGPARAPVVNRAPDPSMQSGVASAQASTTGTKYTLSYDTSIFHTATQSALLTRTTTSLDTIIGSLNATPGQSGNAMRLWVTAGETISVGVWMRCSVANWQSRITLLWKDTGGTNIGAAVNGPQTTNNAANTWVFVKFENTVAPATAAMLTVQAVALTPSGNCVGGELMWTDDLIVVSGPTVPAYFDGRTSGAVWLGPTDQSVSVKWPAGLPAIYNRAIDPSMESGQVNSQSSSNGTLYVVTLADATCPVGARFGSVVAKTARTATTPSNVVGVCYVSTASNSSLFRCAATPGETVSAAVYEYCAIAGHRAMLTAQWRDSAGAAIGGPVDGPLSLGLSTSGWNRILLENIVAPAGTVTVAFYLSVTLQAGDTTVGGETFWGDGLMVNSGAAAMTYADGATPGWMWSGGPNLSSSIPQDVGPWTRWSGAAEMRLTNPGVYDGSVIQPTALATAEVA